MGYCRLLMQHLIVRTKRKLQTQGPWVQNRRGNNSIVVLHGKIICHVNKGPTRCNSMQTFIHCHVTLHVSGVTQSGVRCQVSGVLKTVSATSGVRHGNGAVTSFHRGRIRPRWKEVTAPLPWHTPEVADTVFSTPDDKRVTPETCRVTWQWINICILLHWVGPLLTLNHDAQNHVFKIICHVENTLYKMTVSNNCTLSVQNGILSKYVPFDKWYMTDIST